MSDTHYETILICSALFRAAIFNQKMEKFPPGHYHHASGLSTRGHSKWKRDHFLTHWLSLFLFSDGISGKIIWRENYRSSSFLSVLTHNHYLYISNMFYGSCIGRIFVWLPNDLSWFYGSWFHLRFFAQLCLFKSDMAPKQNRSFFDSRHLININILGRNMHH